MELNLPPHLNNVAALALPCKCTQQIVHVKPLTFCAKKHQTLFRRTVPMASKYPRSEPSRLQDLGCHAALCLPDKNL